jgi:hypothetical protein
MSIKRAWTDQPSTSQLLHALHGTRVLVDAGNRAFEDSVTVYFTEGGTVSMEAPPEALSPGWPKEVKQRRRAGRAPLELRV